MSSGTDSAVEGAAISLPKGGGAISGLGEKFGPDLLTGTGNFTVPLALPAGRAGATPGLSLGYSSGQGNGPFGLGWSLGVPGVARKTSRGVPRYRDGAALGSAERPDVFVLSGAEDLVPVAGSYPGRVRYRPRTEGVFARIEHVADGLDDYWEVRAKDGSVSRYGTARPDAAPTTWSDPAVLADPADRSRVFAWRLTQTVDPLGNVVRYDYLADTGQEPGHAWRQPLLASISYADYGDRAAPSFLVQVDFGYEARPDAFSDRKAGFEVRTSLRCSTIRVSTHAADGIARTTREYRLSYRQADFNGVSLLTGVDAVGIDDQNLAPGQDPVEEALPPLRFGYSGFDPARRRFQSVTGPGLPTQVLSTPTLALVDTRGVGLPDVVELGATRRMWRNAGGGVFELPRPLNQAPPLSLADPGVRFMDVDGDGRADLVVSTATAGGRSPRAVSRGGGLAGAVAGFYPTTFDGTWAARSFQPYRQSPSVALADPAVHLVDLDGDGLTDLLRSGTRLEGWFNDPDPRLAWTRTATADPVGPQVDLSDPRVRLADMTGDGLQDIVLLANGGVTYWPNLGHNRWGQQVTMRLSPRLAGRTDGGPGYDPRRVLLGDLDGDGAADLAYVDNGRILLWGNQSGNAWTDQPVVINGTPALTGADSVQLSDLYGSGTAGLLFSRGTTDSSGRPYLRFLDPCGGVKPHLLATIDNSLGAVTRVTYAPSTGEYLRDARDPATQWRTTLPFPVHVVAKVEVDDAISGGRLTTRYAYHHGYWDGAEREFRGFAMVEHTDTETFDEAPATGPGAVPDGHFSPPTLTRTWFHVGPVAAVDVRDWTELDLTGEYWSGDPPMLSRPAGQAAMLAAMPRAARRDAIRSMRGHVLRTELYALDGTPRQSRPYTVTESVVGVREESPLAVTDPSDRLRIFFPFVLGARTTQWERGGDPMTQFTFPTGYDAYGLPLGQFTAAVPRGRDPITADPTATEPYLATYATTEYAQLDDATHYLVNRVARTTTYEVVNDGTATVFDTRDAALTTPAGAAVSLRLIAHERTFYDGDAFVGLPLGTLGDHGLPVRSESLMFQDPFLDTMFDPTDPNAVTPRPAYLAPAGVTMWPTEYPAEFRTSLPPLAGYVHYGDADVPGSPGGYYATTARHRYDVHDQARVPRGLLIASLDPLGASSTIDYDAHDLLATGVTDAVGLGTTAVNDYRMLHPHTVTDPNGNSSSVTFSPAGLVTEAFVRGKNGAGDIDLPSSRTEYDLLGFLHRGQPASVRVTRRVHHDSDTAVPAADRDDVIVSVEYSDGFGRVVQTRTQTEDTLFGDRTFGTGIIPADQAAAVGDAVGRTRADTDPDNVVVSGWQVYDNKGQVVLSYEPFFATGFDYAPPTDDQFGRRTTTFYDPRGHAVRTVDPDGSEHRLVLGIPPDPANPDEYEATPWVTYTYDPNDNAGRTHPSTSTGYQHHWNTPASAESDALGRTVRAVARNGAAQEDWFTTSTAYDIRGNVLSITDPDGRQAFTYAYDLANRRWRVDGIDGGRRDSVLDVLGHPVESRDAKGALGLTVFDVLHRPTRGWARDTAGGTVTLRQRIEYGDAGTPDQPAADRAAARTANLLGRPVRQYDEAGAATTDAADFKGNLLQTTRRMIADEPILATYAQAQVDGWTVPAFVVDWTPRPGQAQADRDAELLEPSGYVNTTVYDALNRVVSHLLPTDVNGARRQVIPTYNRAGALDQVTVDGTVYVTRIAYDANGQRALIAYGNGVMTRYAYDPTTFRLTRLRTEPYTQPDPATYHPAGPVLQDYGYEYDLAGNLLTLRDRTPGSGLPVTKDALDRVFDYDPIYRLLSATGREQATPPNQDPWIDLPRAVDVTKTQPYTETYTYDPVGNLVRLAHASAGGYTRAYSMVNGSNRVTRMTVGQTPYDYTFDANGNLVGETTTRLYGWNHADRLATFTTRTPGAEPSVHAHYLYDAAGQRVKKLVRRQGGAVEVTHYLNGLFEHQRWPGGENNHVHVVDDHQRIALVRIGPSHPDDQGPATAYQLTDHLGSSTVVLDGTGALTNREEYTPYGETSFGSYTRKRYRFTGRERDEESSLTYHSARYCVPWLARWTASDPSGPNGGLNQYAYCAGNPVTYVDGTGLGPAEARQENELSARLNDIDGSKELFEQAWRAGDTIAAARRQATDAQRAYHETKANLPEHGAGTEADRIRLDTSYRRMVAAQQALQAARSRFSEVVAQLKGRLEYLNGKGAKTAKRIASEYPETVERLAAVRTRVSNAVSAAETAIGGEVAAAKWRFVRPTVPRADIRGRGRRGGGGGRGGGAGPAERAPGRFRGMLGSTVSGVMGGVAVLSLVDAGADIVADATHGHGWRAAGKTVEVGATTVASFTVAAPVALAYGVGRTYWADRENIDDAGGEAADHLVGRDHPIIGGVIASGYAVGVSVGRTAEGIASSAGCGAVHLSHGAAALYHFVGSIF